MPSRRGLTALAVLLQDRLHISRETGGGRKVRGGQKHDPGGGCGRVLLNLIVEVIGFPIHGSISPLAPLGRGLGFVSQF